MFFFCVAENPKQKAWFAKTDIKDLFSFHDDDKEEENARLRDSMAPTSTNAGLPSAGVVNLFEGVNTDETGPENPPRHLDINVNDGDRIMVEGICELNNIPYLLFAIYSCKL